MGNTTWTQEQQRVISLRDCNILVSAAAGSGKTAVLVERILQEVMDSRHPIDIDRLLVVTFTKAAAGQMRTRIGEAMEQRLLEEPDNERLQRQLALLHNAQITTIDSFCQNIIRNYFHVIGLDPVFRVADEAEMTIMRGQVLDEVLEESYRQAEEMDAAEDGLPGDFLQLVDMLSSGRDDSAVETLIQDLYQMAMSAPWPSDWLAYVREQYRCSNMEELLRSEWFQELERYIGEMLDGYLERARQTKVICDTEGPAEYSVTIQSDIEQLERCVKENTYQGYATALAALHKERMARSSAEKEQREFVQGLRKGYMDNGVFVLRDDFFFQSPEEIVRELNHMYPAVCALTCVTERFINALAERKREEGVLDFGDMEHFALQILVDHEHGDVPSETARELQEYYQEIMIDEYQDSSYIQEALLSSLCRADTNQRPYLFMVGDVKQSIYRFRQARPELFNAKYEAYQEGEEGTRIDLHKNFRSRAMVLESANYLFRQLMQKCLGGIEYNEAACLVPGADFPESDARLVGRSQILLIQEERSVMDKVTLEASVIGEKIHELTQGSDPLYVMGSNGYHPVQYRDIVILLRSPNMISEKYIEVLAGMGIPAYSETRTGYFGSMEVETILDFLRVIDNPRQDIPLAAVLRSPLAGLTDDELAVIGALPRELNYLDAIITGMAADQFGGGIRTKLSRFMDMLERYRDQAQILSVYEILRLIYQETRYYDIMSAMPAGEKRAANLDLLLQRALEYAQKGNNGIFSFVRYIESLKKAQIDFGEASLTNENMNAVRIMSIHKSKGLEFPVVFLAGMSKGINQTDAKGTVKDSDYGIGIDYVDLEGRYRRATPFKRFLAGLSRRNTLAEEIRILYVALTRAKELLILTGTVDDIDKQRKKWEAGLPEYGLLELVSAKRYMDWIMPLAYAQGADRYFQIEEWDVTRLTRQAAGQMAEEILQQQDLEHWDTEICYDEEVCRQLTDEEQFEYPYEREQDIPAKISVSELKRLEQRVHQIQEDSAQEDSVQIDTTEEEIPEPAFLSEERKLTAMERGILYHLAFEHLPYGRLNADSSEKELGDWLEELVETGYMSREERETLDARKVKDFLQSAIGQRMAAASGQNRLHREQQFMLGIPATTIYPDCVSDEIVLVQGIIDAWFLEGEEVVLVDYKTDKVKPGGLKELAKKYQTQLWYYTEALQRLTGYRVKEQIIYSVPLGKSITVGFPREVK